MIKNRETSRLRQPCDNQRKRERHQFRMVRFYILFCILFCQKQKYKSSNTHFKVVLSERNTRRVLAFSFSLLNSRQSKKKKEIPFEIFCVEMPLRGRKKKRKENELEKEEKVKENEIQGETRRITKNGLDETIVGKVFDVGSVSR